MLRLTIIESPPGEMPAGETLVVGPAGATVGRAAENTWVLTDTESKLSRSHCAVLYENGHYLVVDTSSNGTFLDDNVQALGRGQKAPLESGSRIRLGDYTLQVSLETTQEIPVPPIGPEPDFIRRQEKRIEPEIIPEQQSRPFEPGKPNPAPDLFPDIEPKTLEDNPFDIPSRKPRSDPFGGYPSTPFDNLPGADSNPWDLNPGGSPTPGPAIPTPEPIPKDWQSSPEQITPRPNSAEPFEEQQVPLGTNAIPDDWYKTVDPSPLPEPPPPPKPKPVAPLPSPAKKKPITQDQTSAQEPYSQDQSALQSRLRQALAGALGPHADSLSTSELIRVVEEMAAMIELSVPELMRALASRSQFKEHLRLNQTMVRARDNNPLKFCESTEEALEHMLLNDHPGLLQGKLALEQAFRELAAHQTALVGALQPSLRETLEQLSPASIEAFVGSEGIAGFGLPKGKGKLWDTYLEIYKKLAESERGTLEQKFMRSLGKYYERSLNALK